MIFEKSCGAIVYRQEASRFTFLLIKHRSGHWGFPKGHVELHETEEETARREIQEETNLRVNLETRFRQSLSYAPAAGHWKEVIYFLAELHPQSPDARPQLSELSELAWLDFDAALVRLTYSSDKKLLTKAKDFLLQGETQTHA